MDIVSMHFECVSGAHISFCSRRAFFSTRYWEGKAQRSLQLSMETFEKIIFLHWLAISQATQ